MKTPSIERRFVAVGLCVVVILVIALDVLLYFSARASVRADANEALDARAAVVKAEATLLAPRLLAKRLDQIGIEAIVIDPEGRPFPTNPDVEAPRDTPRTSREVRLDDGSRVVVFVRSSSGDNRLTRLLVFEAIASPLVILFAAALLRWIAEIATSPLDEITARARRTARGRRGERLEPDKPETRLGQMATAYDAMLDSLEGAVAEATAARAESDRLEKGTREMASQLEASLVALEAAVQDARESEARTRRFLDDAAHQLRAPITSIRACTETLMRDVTPEQRQRLLDAVCRESERASRLMAGLLRMARLGHEQELRVESTDVLALCEEEADTARLDSPHLEVTVTRVGREPGPISLAADAAAEILSNLVDNARRHARSRIDISVELVDGVMVLRVVDDGPGLPEGQAEAAFERFVSLDNKGGSGLGLSIGRQLARSRGGDLTYEDGAFVLRLPVEAEPEGHQIPGEEEVGAPDLTPHRS